MSDRARFPDDPSSRGAQDGAGHESDVGGGIDPDIDHDVHDLHDTDHDIDQASLDAALEADAGLLGMHLRELLEPETDLGHQTTEYVDRTLRARSALSSGLDLLGLGWLTMRELLSDEPLRADGEGEGT